MKNKLLQGATLVIASTLLTGCDRNMPDCDDPNIQDMLISHIKRSLYDDENVITLSDLETAYHDRGVNLRICNGNLQIENVKSGEKIPFSYRIQYLDVEHKVYDVIVYPSE